MYARVQKEGKQYQERTDNAIIGKFTHVIARRAKDGEKDKKADPQLHTHCVIANATKCRDEVWRSVVFDKLYENKMNLGELYRIELGRNVKGLGYEVNVEKDRVRRITFEIAGVSEKTIKEFSQRRQDILKMADEMRKE